MQRRRFLATTASMGVVGLAGCTSSSEYELVVEDKTQGIQSIEHHGPEILLLSTSGVSVTLATGIEPTPNAWAFLTEGDQEDAGELDTGEHRFESRNVRFRGKTTRVIVTHGGNVTHGLESTLEGGDIIEEATFRVEEVTR